MWFGIIDVEIGGERIVFFRADLPFMRKGECALFLREIVDEPWVLEAETVEIFAVGMRLFEAVSSAGFAEANRVSDVFFLGTRTFGDGMSATSLRLRTLGKAPRPASSECSRLLGAYCRFGVGMDFSFKEDGPSIIQIQSQGFEK